MATVAYTLVGVCTGGCHATIDVSLNGGAAQRLRYDVDQIRAPLASMSQEDREEAFLVVLKAHMAGKTRAQIATEFQSTVTVTL